METIFSIGANVQDINGKKHRLSFKVALENSRSFANGMWALFKDNEKRHKEYHFNLLPNKTFYIIPENTGFNLNMNNKKQIMLSEEVLIEFAYNSSRKAYKIADKNNINLPSHKVYLIRDTRSTELGEDDAWWKKYD